MTRSSDAKADFDELRSNNSDLNTTVSELRLEIAYYQGETKRLEWEKTQLKQDVGKMSALFKGWLSELQNSNTRSVLDDSDFFTNLVKYPSKNISDVLQMNDAKLLITTCQAPFYIEVMPASCFLLVCKENYLRWYPHNSLIFIIPAETSSLLFNYTRQHAHLLTGHLFLHPTDCDVAIALR